MAGYFTSDHFKYLNKWKGVEYDNTNPEQQKVYKELTDAYNITKSWAEALQSKIFPKGWTKTVRKPTDQWQKRFISYNWARVYPTKSSPEGLAYTVGIDADEGFVVKLDLVDVKIKDPALRAKYESIRGPFDNSSAIVSILPAVDGLAKSLSELVDWSIEEINKFQLTYDEVARKLGIPPSEPPLNLLKHFRDHKYFVMYQLNWKPDITALFCRFVAAVHQAGLDIWNANEVIISFGRKDGPNTLARKIGSISIHPEIFRVAWNQVGKLSSLGDSAISEEIVANMEKFSNLDIIERKIEIFNGSSRNQFFWPDDYDGTPTNDEDNGVVSIMRSTFNRIYYGPPGTGKTYQLLKLLNQDYTDDQAIEDPETWLIEQVRGLNWFQIIALILLETGKSIKVADIVGHKFYQSKARANARTGNLTQTAWGYLQRHTWSKSTTVDAALERRAEIAVFDKDDNSNWYIVQDLKEQLADLVPVLAQLQAGPEPWAVNKRYAFVTFHQSYGYEEFVEGLRPELGNDANDQVRYEVSQGALRKLCSQAEADPDNFYAMVIDEINRGNISKIFGELITLIENDKRAGSELAVPVTLPYSGDQFIIPRNVDFIGSMNTADRSLALVDTALRRRFEFVPVLPDPNVLKGLQITAAGMTIDVQKLLVVINNRIEALYDRDHTIGHAYFTHIAKLDSAEQFPALKAAFQNKIIPLLEEYFFEDWQKIRLVLGDNQKKGEFQFIKEVEREDDLVELFGHNHQLDQYATQARYRLNEPSLDLPKAYVGIYAPVV